MVQRVARLGQRILGPGQRLAVVRGQQSPADHLARLLFEQVMGQGDVAEALGHLLVGHVQEAVVQPVVGVAAVVMAVAHTLGELVLVVREDQVDAAAVDVDRQAQLLLDHRRAFDVPAGPA